MRKVAALSLVLLAAAGGAACESLLPFDRSLIREDAGTGSSPPDDDAPAHEGSASMPDAPVSSGDAGDAAVDLDGRGEEAQAAGDGGGDAASSRDGASDASDGGGHD